MLKYVKYVKICYNFNNDIKTLKINNWPKSLSGYATIKSYILQNIVKLINKVYTNKVCELRVICTETVLITGARWRAWEINPIRIIFKLLLLQSVYPVTLNTHDEIGV